MKSLRQQRFEIVAGFMKRLVVNSNTQLLGHGGPRSQLQILSNELDFLNQPYFDVCIL